MEETGDYSLCILCGYSFPGPNILFPGDGSTSKSFKVFDKFIHQVNLKQLSSAGLIDTRGVSVCKECLAEVEKAVERREQVEEVEVHVRTVQEEILRLMGQLRKLVDGYLEEMRRIGDKVRWSDEQCLRSKLAGRRGRLKKGSWTRENVLEFRDGVLNVVHDLTRFRSDLYSKLITGITDEDLLRPDAALTESALKLSEQVKIESSAYQEETEDPLLDLQDFTLSPVGTDPFDYDDPADKDYIVPDSSKVKGKASSRKCTTTNFESGSSNIQSEDSDQEWEQPSPSKSKKRKRPNTRTRRIKPWPAWYTVIHPNNVNAKYPTPRSFLCSLCPNFETRTIFVFEQHLRAHDRRILAQPQAQALECSKCPAKFGYERSREFHEYCHQNLFTTRCDICRQKVGFFSMKEHLAKVHGIEKVFECGSCVQVHSSRQKYLKHLDLHTQQDVLLNCDLCPETFVKKLEIIKHYQAIHGLMNLYTEETKPEESGNAKPEVSEEPEDVSKRSRPPWYRIITGRLQSKLKGVPTFSCLLCPDFAARNQFQLEQHLRGHERSVSVEEKQFRCPHCPGIFGVEQHFQLHQCYHQGSFKMLCDQCRVPQLVFSLKEHLQQCHGVENCYSCSNCSYVSSEKGHWRHLFNHHWGSDALFVCYLCPGIPPFAVRSQLVQHFKGEHNMEIDEGRLAKASEKQRQARRSKTGGRVLCPECGKSLKPNSLKDHMECVHSNNERPYQCPDCDKAFKTRANLSGHSAIHKRDGSGPQFQCHLCSKGFKQKESFEGHMRLHDGTGLTCEQCGALFGDGKLLRAHLKTHQRHEKIQWWQCTKCPFKFKVQQQLEHHQRVHNRPRGTENRCSVCQKCFYTLAQLKVHVESVHSGTKNFACNFCGLAISSKANLQGHKRKRHPVEYQRALQRNRMPAASESLSTSPNPLN